MAIQIGNNIWRTLAEPIYVNGKVVKEVWANGLMVYPERINMRGNFIKIRGWRHVEASGANVQQADDYRYTIAHDRDFEIEAAFVAVLYADDDWIDFITRDVSVPNEYVLNGGYFKYDEYIRFIDLFPLELARNLSVTPTNGLQIDYGQNNYVFGPEHLHGICAYKQKISPVPVPSVYGQINSGIDAPADLRMPEYLYNTQFCSQNSKILYSDVHSSDYTVFQNPETNYQSPYAESLSPNGNIAIFKNLTRLQPVGDIHQLASMIIDISQVDYSYYYYTNYGNDEGAFDLISELGEDAKYAPSILNGVTKKRKYKYTNYKARYMYRVPITEVVYVGFKETAPESTMQINDGDIAFLNSKVS